MADTDDIDPEKALSALEKLEAEYQRRIEEKITAGELRLIDLGSIAVSSEDEIDGAVEKARAVAIAEYGNRPPLHFEYLVIVTGVPRGPGRYRPNLLEAPDTTGPVYPKKDNLPVFRSTDDVPAICAPAQADTPVQIVLDNGNDDDPGRIAAGWFSVENGSVVLEAIDRRHLGSQLLLEGQDPLTVARGLLRKSATGDKTEFNRRLRYPSGGVA